MDRFEARKKIGNLMLVDENKQGKYVGELLDVITIPKKPWRGLVKITRVIEFPSQNWSHGHIDSINIPIYSEGEIIEISGSKIKPYTSKTVAISYDKSVLDCITNLIKMNSEIFEKNPKAIKQLQTLMDKHFPNVKMKVITKERRRSKKESSVISDKYIEYVVKQIDAKPVLMNDFENTLPLEDCPFELELKMDDEWIPGIYTENWLFEGLNGKKYLLRENHIVRLAKKHLEPYQLLLNELEKPALDSLEKSLKIYNLNHKHLISCHNQLLVQLLQANGEKHFSGVNFMLYQKGEKTVVVQHHYERQLVEDGMDKIFDRFELTSNLGKRTIITYNNEFSRDR